MERLARVDSNLEQLLAHQTLPQDKGLAETQPSHLMKSFRKTFWLLTRKMKKSTQLPVFRDARKIRCHPESPSRQVKWTASFKRWKKSIMMPKFWRGWKSLRGKTAKLHSRLHVHDVIGSDAWGLRLSDGPRPSLQSGSLPERRTKS